MRIDTKQAWLAFALMVPLSLIRAESDTFENRCSELPERIAKLDCPNALSEVLIFLESSRPTLSGYSPITNGSKGKMEKLLLASRGIEETMKDCLVKVDKDPNVSALITAYAQIGSANFHIEKMLEHPDYVDFARNVSLDSYEKSVVALKKYLAPK